MAAPTLVAESALAVATTGTSVTTVMPAGIEADDIAILALMHNGSSTFSEPTDWDPIGTAVQSANQSTAWFWKRIGVGSDANPVSNTSVTNSGTSAAYGRIRIYRGVIATGTPFEQVGNAGTPTSSTTPTGSAVTTSEDDELVVTLVTVDDDNVWSVAPPPADWSHTGTRVATSTGGDCMMDSIERSVPTAGAIAAATVGTMNAADFWRTLTFALLPAPSGPVLGVLSSHAGSTAQMVGTVIRHNEAPATRHPVVAVLAVDDPTAWNVHPFYKHIVTPANLGNQTDVDAIESSLETAWPQRKGVVLIGEDEGCTALMNWAFAHFEEVHHITLRRPILDFEERHARVGGATATAIDAAFGPRGNYLELPGSVDNYASSPSHSSFNVTNQIDIRVELANVQWDFGGFLENIVCRAVGGSQNSFRLRVTGARFLEFLWSSDGSNGLSAVSTVRPETVIPARTAGAIRVTFQGVDGGNKTVRFYTSDSITGTWTQLGDPVTTAGNSSIFASTSAIEIGSSNTGDGDAFVFNYGGKIWEVEIRSTIGGTVILDANFRNVTPGSTSFTDSVGRTINLHGTAAIVVAHKVEASRYNPGHTHRMSIAAHWFADRIDVWRDPSDTQTPAAVTDAIATAMRAKLHDELGTEASAAPPRRVLDWYDKPAYAQMEQIYEWSRANDSDHFRAADGGAAAVVPSGESISLFGDTLRSVAIDPDDSYRMPIVFDRNSAIIRSPAGVITGQVWHDGSAPGVAFEPDLVENPNCFYWPSGVCMDNNELKAVMMMREGGGGFGTFVDMHVLSIDVDTFAITNRLSLGEPEITLESAIPDPDSGYVWLVLIDPSRIARVPIGSYSDLSQWRYWDGASWNTSHNAAQPLQRNLPGGGTGPLVIDTLHQTWTLRRYRGGWLAAFLAWFYDYIPVYYASSPEQPWTWLTNLHIPESSGDRWGARIFSYGLHWHPEMDPGPDSLMLSYNHQPIEETTYGTEEIDFFFQNLQFRVVTIHRELVFP